MYKIMQIRFALILMLLLTPLAIQADGFPEINDWRPVGKMTVMHPDNLWEYINGAADQYLSYDFRLLRYRDFTNDNKTITVDIYDMGSALNAYGIYTTERPADAKPSVIGTTATVRPPLVFLLLKDRYYIKINILKGHLDSQTGTRILTDIANALKGSTELPQELKSLPVLNRQAGSERFIREGYMGLSELKDVVSAQYSDADGTYRCFRLATRPDQPHATIWDALSEKWQPDASKTAPIRYRKVPYQGIVGVIQLDHGVFGVTDSPDLTVMQHRMDAFLK